MLKLGTAYGTIHGLVSEKKPLVLGEKGWEFMVLAIWS